MRDKQGRNDPLVPVMPEVAVHRDGGLRRPAQEAARPASNTADATTALEAALSARIAHIFYPPPPGTYVLVPLYSRTPVTHYTPPTYLFTARP